MTCSNCGTISNDGSKFCIKCGNPMATVINEQPMQQQTPVQQQAPVIDSNTNMNFQQPNTQMRNMNSNFVETPQLMQNPIVNEFTNVSVKTVEENYQQSSGSLNFISFILNVLLKPITSIKEEINKFNDTKTSLIFALIVAGATTVINLVKTMFAVVRVKGYDWSTGKNTTTWTWDNLKNLQWGDLIVKNFLLYAGILLAIALVYFLASTIVKKQASFKKLLGIASITVIPFILASIILSPILGMIYAPLGMIATVIGAVYSILLLIDSVNRELALEDNDAKMYINLACLSILGSAGYYVFMKFL